MGSGFISLVKRSLPISEVTVWIQSSAKFIWTLFTINCIEKTNIGKEKEAGNGPLFLKRCCGHSRKGQWRLLGKELAQTVDIWFNKFELTSWKVVSAAADEDEWSWNSGLSHSMSSSSSKSLRIFGGKLMLRSESDSSISFRRDKLCWEERKGWISVTSNRCYETFLRNSRKSRFPPKQ